MNRVILMGRLTRDPDVRYSNGPEPMAIATYTLAVDRRMKRTDSNQQTADFIRCKAFGKDGEFAEKYLHQGTKIVICGHIQTGSYKDRDGKTVYTTDVIAEDQEFAESKAAQSGNTQPNNQAAQQNSQSIDGFMPAPDDMEGLPFA